MLDLPTELIDKIDQQNETGTRSNFISDMLYNQLNTNISSMRQIDETGELKSSICNDSKKLSFSGELKLTTNQGRVVGNYNINDMKSFSLMVETIGKLSDDPMVRMKARKIR